MAEPLRDLREQTGPFRSPFLQQWHLVVASHASEEKRDAGIVRIVLNDDCVVALGSLEKGVRIVPEYGRTAAPLRPPPQ